MRRKETGVNGSLISQWAWLGLGQRAARSAGLTHFSDIRQISPRVRRVSLRTFQISSSVSTSISTMARIHTDKGTHQDRNVTPSLTPKLGAGSLILFMKVCTPDNAHRTCQSPGRNNM